MSALEQLRIADRDLAGPRAAGGHPLLNSYARFWSDRVDSLERVLRDEDARNSKSPEPEEGDCK